MKILKLLLLSVLSGLLLSFGWFPNGFLPLIFIAFIPLLIAESVVSHNTFRRKRLILFLLSYLTFLLWNVITTWWIKNASAGGAAMAILCNALLMTFVFMFYSKVKNRIGEKFAGILFICFWLTFEFIHYHWDLSWTWLTLGNVFADAPKIIQWYQFTGVFGGSLWILIINIILFSFITFREDRIIFFKGIQYEINNTKQGSNKKCGVTKNHNAYVH